MKTKEEIIGYLDCSIVPISIPEWDTDMYMRKLTGAEVTKLRNLGTQKKEATFIMAATCCLSLCDELGIQLFSLSDAASLEKKSFDALDRVSTEILIHSGCMKKPEGEGEEKN